MAADWSMLAFSASCPSALSLNISPSCSALNCMMKRVTAFFDFMVSWSSGSFFDISSRLAAKKASASPSDSDSPPSKDVLVSGIAKPPSGPSPRFTHFAMSASRRARLAAKALSTSSSVSSTTTIPPSKLVSFSVVAGPVSNSSRQAPRRPSWPACGKVPTSAGAAPPVRGAARDGSSSGAASSLFRRLFFPFAFFSPFRLSLCGLRLLEALRLRSPPPPP
mmetsp:Transcript_45848/g.97950  ORF Transcript_45848/g.97950 Transcript_45848/m.97950 type:complete len:221 (+) Transcript_45848:1263-1925(+)